MLPQVSLANGGSDSDSSNLDESSEAAMSLAVRSKDELQLTVTKTCLDVFTKLGAVREKKWNLLFCVLRVTPDLKVPFHICRLLKRLLLWKAQEWLLWRMFHPFRYGMRFAITG